MERLELNIPTIYSHSIFLNSKEEVRRLSATQLNYFYSLIYLYREKILEDYPNILVEDENSKKIINDEVFKNIGYIEISLNEIETLINSSHDSKYKNLQEFIKNMKKEDLCIKTNILNKNKTTNSKVHKMIDKLHFSCDKLDINIIFEKEFIRPFILVDKYFKKVTLNHFFNLKSCNDKPLYLMLKDYVNYKKNISKKDLALFVGKSFNFSRFNLLIENINSNTDIFISYTLDKRKRNFKFEIKNQTRFFNENEELEYNINRLIWNEVEKRVLIARDENKDIGDIEKYKKGIFKNIKKNEITNFESKAKLDSFIKKGIEQFKKNKSFKKSFLLLDLGNFNDEVTNIDGYIINDNYELESYPYPVIKSNSSEETYSIIKDNYVEMYEVESDNRKSCKKSSF